MRTVVLAALLLLSSEASVRALPARQDSHGPTLEEARGLLDGQDFAAAAQAFRKIVEREPENGRAWFYLGYALHVLGRF